MKTKKLFLILIAIVFVFALIFSVIFLFTVKKVEVNFELSYTDSATEFEDALLSFENKNLLFVKEEDVMAVQDSFPYFEITGVEKKYPNVLSVSVKERIERICVEKDGCYYLCDENGILLSDQQTMPSGLLSVKISGLNCISTAKGQAIDTDNCFLSELFVLLKDQTVTLSVKDVKIEVAPEKADVIFNTLTGVAITVTKSNEGFLQKAHAGFNSYNQSATDYQKMDSDIEVIRLDGGEIKCIWIDK